VSDPIDESTGRDRPRRRPLTPTAWATLALAATFVVLWIVFAVRAVDRNDVTPPTVTLPPATASPDLRATADAANRLLFPDATPGGTPVASPVASPAQALPAGTPAATPVTSPAATPATSPAATPIN